MNILEKSTMLKQKRKVFVEEYLNPLEAEIKAFIMEIIKEYDIKTAEDWNEYAHLIPDSAIKLMMSMDYYKKK